MTDKLHGRKILKVEGILEEFEKDKVKAGVDIVDLFSSFGIDLIAKGSSFVGHCPWHEDSTPSLSVDREKGLYNCFGCGESGDAFTLVQKMKGLGFRESIEYLKHTTIFPAVMEPPRVQKPTAGNHAPRTDTELSSEQRVQLLSQCMEHWRRTLETCEEAHEYLVSRGLHDRQVWNEFFLGYSDGSLGKKLSNSQRDSLITLGVMSEGRKEVFSGSIIIPLYDADGTIVSLYGRAIDKPRRPAHRYLKGPRRGLVNTKALSVYRDRIIVTESIIDALSLYQAGVKNVIPAYGTGGVGDNGIRSLVSERVQQVVVAFDNDDAGQKGADALASRLNDAGIPTEQVVPPQEYKDWNQWLVSGGLTKEAWNRLFSAEPPTQSRVPDDGEPAAPRLQAHKDAGVWSFVLQNRSYRALGVKEVFVSSLRINLRLESEHGKHLDNCDLYSARSRSSFASGAQAMTGIESSVIEKDLIGILEYLEELRDTALAERELEQVQIELTDEQRTLGRTFLERADLCECIVADIETLGYGGEDINKLLVYLAAASRKLDDPISVIVVSESASGKSFLVDTVKKLIPDEDVVAMTSLSDQALQYLPPDALLHKFLVMGEAVHGQVVEHQVREMLSARELRRLVTQKDPKTGDLTSRMVARKVIVSAVMSSTNNDINPENASRSFVINTDESTQHTRRIHELQRMKYSLKRYREKETVIPDIIARHHAAQRLLEKVRIVNGFAPLLDFPHNLMRSRRDHERFIDLIAVVCFLRQFQKSRHVDEQGIEYIECDISDYQIAHRIMQQTLPSTLTNFPSHAQTMFERLREIIRKKARLYELAFSETSVTQREIREATGFSQMSVKRAMRTLVDWEYVHVSGSRTQGTRNSYRILEDIQLQLIDLSMIPDPQVMQKKLATSQKSGSGRSAWGTTGSDPV